MLSDLGLVVVRLMRASLTLSLQPPVLRLCLALDCIPLLARVGGVVSFPMEQKEGNLSWFILAVAGGEFLLLFLLDSHYRLSVLEKSMFKSSAAFDPAIQLMNLTMVITELSKGLNL